MIGSSYQSSLTPPPPPPPPINQKLLTIRSSYQLIASLVDQQTCCGREFLSELTVILIESLIDQQTFPIGVHPFLDRATHVLRSRAALIRAHWLPDWSEYPCDQELVSKLFDSPIDQQTCCSQELLPELIKCFSNKNRGYRHPNWQSSFLPLGALIGAH